MGRLGVKGGWVKGGSRGGAWKCSKLGPTHRWLSVGGGGVYICMYVCTYVFMP